MVTCHARRFIENCKSSIHGKDLLFSDVTPDKKAVAKNLWLINEQKSMDRKTLSQLTISLGAYVDNDGIIKLYGRLEHSNLSLKSKYPVFIPNESEIGRLIIFDAHKRVFIPG